MQNRTKRTPRLVFVLVSTMLVGCGGASNEVSNNGAITATKDARIASMVPKAIAKTGKVTVGMDATFPPMGFVSDNGKSIIGAEADLAKALGQVIGLKLTIKQQPFAAILPRVERNDYALGLSAITDTKEREQQVNMVTYFSAGTSFYTAAKGGTQISGIDGICGVSVAVVNGTLPAADVRAQDAKCRELGRSPVKIVPLKEQAEHIQAVESGKVEVGLFDSPVVAYIVSKSEGKLIHTGEPYGEAPYGIAVSKSSNMTPVVLAAMKSLVANGQYAAILKEWGLSDGAISEPKVNDGS